jgi:5'-methylthioadenosine phosphorylase
MTTAEIGVFGGSGFYSLLDDAEEIVLDTPFGAPSAPITIGEIEGRRVAFLPRHGRHHEHPPHRVPYRANVWAMKELGVSRLFGPCAVGSLKREIAPGNFVLCDQAVDFTKHRPTTMYDGPQTTHVSFADPYCPTMRNTLAAEVAALGIPHRTTGTIVVIEGPRFSTRAESAMFAGMGFDVINMSQFPEVSLAREMEICFANVSLVTDYDVGVDDVPPVTHEQVVQVFDSNLAGLRELLFAAIPALPAHRDCACATALTGARFEV